MKETRTVATGMLVVSAIVGGALLARGAAAGPATPKKGIDSDADRLLHQMADTLAGLKSFKVRSSAADQVVTKTGQKVQFVSESDVSVERPNRMRADTVGPDSGLAFWYDGQTMTLACKSDHSYATAPAPANLDDMIDKARKQFQADAPGADLLYSKPYEILTEQVTEGRLLGRETIDGKPANHLAFQGEDVDWQIWIQDGAQSLPLRFVITSKKVKGAPEFTVRMTNWQTDAKIETAAFAFQAPADAKKVQAIPAECRLPGR